MQNINFSELWKNIDWRKTQKIVFRLQVRLWKAMRASDSVRVRNLQNLILRSRSARLIAIRQVTQLNAGKKTAGVDGQKSLNYQQRFELEERLAKHAFNWKHSKLREIPIPKKDGSLRILKVPTIADRAWQCLIKLALEPAHEATFHERSYGFRQGRSTHDCQKMIFNNLRSLSHGITKRVLELDIQKCFDQICHKALIRRVIAPARIKQRIWQCLKAGASVEFPDIGTPQGGVFSPILANIALNGIERIHQSVRYADDLVFILKPKDNAESIRSQIDEFLAQRGLKVKERKTRLVHSTDGFDFLGWHFKVQQNGKFRSTPSEENFLAFRQKVKEIVNSSNYGAIVKAKKLAPIVRGWRKHSKWRIATA
ncbi:MAG: reverse transcriptase domain-containing protein [Prochloraceae cyanobacterium]|nr:reverse transcriptase domain-containing protein [Prochloraceae cyanobacterium]